MGHPNESRDSNTVSAMELDGGPEHVVGNANFRILTTAEKKKAIDKYRKVFNNVRKIDANDEEFTDMMEKLTTNITDQNECLQQVGVNELMTLDARCISMSSQLSYGLVKKVNIETKFDNREFIRQLRVRVLKHAKKSGVKVTNADPTEITRKIRFEQLFGTGVAYMKAHHQVPTLPRCFKAPIEAKTTPTAPKTRQPRQKTQSAKKTQPTQYDASNMANDVDDSEKRLSYIHNRLGKLEKHQKTVPLVQVAVNPNSFCTTVENFFNISFLARQSKIGLDVPDDVPDDPTQCEPVVKTFEDEKKSNPDAPSTSTQRESEENDHRRNVQSILSFDQEAYQMLIANLEIERAAFK